MNVDDIVDPAIAPAEPALPIAARAGDLPLAIGFVSGVIGHLDDTVAPRPVVHAPLLSELPLLTDPLRAEIALPRPPIRPAVVPPLATHCECLHAARLACRVDLSENEHLSATDTNNS